MENKTKYLLIGVGVVAVGAGAFIYFQHQKKKNNTSNNSIADSFANNASSLPASNASSYPSGSSSSSGGGSSSSGFPLKKGSKGTLVTNLQNALIKKYGARILPKYGADGGFGTETVNALLSKGLPTVITSELFTQLVIGSGGTSSSTNSNSPANISKALHASILKNSLSDALAALSQITDVAGYTAVNTIFKKSRIDFVRKTLVTALLSQFSSAAKKKQINAELYRIGLKYDGNQWALSGIYGIAIDQLITIEPTHVWDGNGRKLNVPTATILGEYLDANNGVTEFETLDRRRLFVKTTSISYAQ
jgi:hypothetical protein